MNDKSGFPAAGFCGRRSAIWRRARAGARRPRPRRSRVPPPPPAPASLPVAARRPPPACLRHAAGRAHAQLLGAVHARGPAVLRVARGRVVRVFSHPADFTPVCTTELGRIAERAYEFSRRGVKLLGHSCDSLEAHRAWIKARHPLHVAQRARRLPLPHHRGRVARAGAAPGHDRRGAALRPRRRQHRARALRHRPRPQGQALHVLPQLHGPQRRRDPARGGLPAADAPPQQHGGDAGRLADGGERDAGAERARGAGGAAVPQGRGDGAHAVGPRLRAHHAPLQRALQGVLGRRLRPLAPHAATQQRMAGHFLTMEMLDKASCTGVRQVH